MSEKEFSSFSDLEVMLSKNSAHAAEDPNALGAFISYAGRIEVYVDRIIKSVYQIIREYLGEQTVLDGKLGIVSRLATDSTIIHEVSHALSGTKHPYNTEEGKRLIGGGKSESEAKKELLKKGIITYTCDDFNHLIDRILGESLE